MNLKSTFGAQVRHHRKAAGLSQEALAARVEVSMETIGKIERGQAAPLFETAEKIAAALDVPAPMLFGTTFAGGTSERARLMAEINGALSRMNDDQLDRASKVLKALVT